MKGMRSLSIVTELSRAPSRSYGKDGRRVHSAKAAAFALIACAALLGGLVTAAAADRPVKIVALGDSLTAGYGLSRPDAFPAQLEKALKAKGIAVEIENAGVSGDTASGGLSRLDWSVAEGTEAVILELGGNDMLRGVAPKVTQQALETIIERLKARNIEVLFAGMRAPPNMSGGDLCARFRGDFFRSRGEIRSRLLPVLSGGDRRAGEIRAGDGMHPNAAGVSQSLPGSRRKSKS